MMELMEKLGKDPRITDYKINTHRRESCELFFVKGKLETVRRTDTCDREVTVYVRHEDFVGDARFILYPSTSAEELDALVDEAVAKALLINNPPYDLPEGGAASYEVPSNFAQWDMMDLSAEVAQLVWQANQLENADLNSVEIFINRHTEAVRNSRGVDLSQVRYDAMLETIPTYNAPQESVELYHQYNFSAFEPEAVLGQIRDKLQEVKDRSEAITQEQILPCKVILRELEISELISNIAEDLHYATVYTHRNLFHKGDMIQKAPTGDKLGITMTGAAQGCVGSARFDGDGLLLDSMRIVDGGKAVAYYGSNRYGQYLQEDPTGELRCMVVDPGSMSREELSQGVYLDVLSMSGLQVDFFSDYIGGEVRLAYYHDGAVSRAVTGISISGKLSQVLESIRLTKDTTAYDSYVGPSRAVLQDMTIF